MAAAKTSGGVPGFAGCQPGNGDDEAGYDLSHEKPCLPLSMDGTVGARKVCGRLFPSIISGSTIICMALLAIKPDRSVFRETYVCSLSPIHAGSESNGTDPERTAQHELPHAVPSVSG